ncbi:MAG: hypothetical protein C0624_12715 [Desulfuromonas sp.]|nr:MAG: hypothetical protein C0624_12715 [Desulfuromonas sp.]
MDAQMMLKLLGWSSLLNMAILLYWSVMIVFARDLVCRWYTRWLPLSQERFAEIHYQGMQYFKLGLFF